MANGFNLRSDHPAISAFAITPNDSVDFDLPTNGLYVGGTGDVSVILINDTTPVTFMAVPAGSLLPLRVKRVRSTGTTATNLVGVY